MSHDHHTADRRAKARRDCLAPEAEPVRFTVADVALLLLFVLLFSRVAPGCL